MAGIASIYNTTGGRAQTDTLYLSADKFFQLAAHRHRERPAGLAGRVSRARHRLDMTGTYSGLRVDQCSYGFSRRTPV